MSMDIWNQIKFNINRSRGKIAGKKNKTNYQDVSKVLLPVALSCAVWTRFLLKIPRVAVGNLYARWVLVQGKLQIIYS